MVLIFRIVFFLQHSVAIISFKFSTDLNNDFLYIYNIRLVSSRGVREPENIGNPLIRTDWKDIGSSRVESWKFRDSRKYRDSRKCSGFLKEFIFLKFRQPDYYFRKSVKNRKFERVYWNEFIKTSLETVIEFSGKTTDSRILNPSGIPTLSGIQNILENPENFENPTRSIRVLAHL